MKYRCDYCSNHCELCMEEDIVLPIHCVCDGTEIVWIRVDA